MTPIRILTVAAALTLFGASAIHSGLFGPIDPFPAAAVPEAVIGAVLIASAIATLLWWPSSRPFALGAAAFSVIGTLVGMRFTVPRGELGDIAYHVVLLGSLVALSWMLVASRERHRRPLSEEWEARRRA